MRPKQPSRGNGDQSCKQHSILFCTEVLSGLDETAIIRIKRPTSIRANHTRSFSMAKPLTTKPKMNSTKYDGVIDGPSDSNASPSGAKRKPDTRGAIVKATPQVEPPKSTLSIALSSAAASPRMWAVITCLLLAISGAHRYWRESSLYGYESEKKECPFPLASLPKVLGPWRFDEGTEAKLEPEIAQIAGASDHFVRSYTDEKSGQSVSVLMLYGLAAYVAYHSPEICYPASGFDAEEAMTDYPLEIPGQNKLAHYRGGFFKRKQAGVTQYVEVIYTFRHAGEWVADASARYKMFRAHPGAFKIQIRRVVDRMDIASSPSIGLLKEFIQQIETRLKEQETTAPDRKAQAHQAVPATKAG